MYHVHKDHLGSYQTLTNENGEVATFDGVEQVCSFDPWGRRRNVTTWDYADVPTAFLFDRGFTGHEHLDAFKLINMNGRVFDPYTNLFLSPDPYVQAPGLTQSYNRYAYCLNNPLVYTDPDGEFWHLIIGAAIGGTSNWLANGADFSWQGLAYFGIGAAAGALSAGVGMGATASLSEASFGAGFIGAPSAMNAISTNFTTSFVSGALVSGASGFTSGFLTGAGNAWMQGEDFGKGLWSGTRQGVKSGIWGAAIGGTLGGLDAMQDRRKFFVGGLRTDEFGNTIPSRNDIAGQVEKIRERLEKELIEEEELSGWGTVTEEFTDAKINDFELLSIKKEKKLFYIHREALIKHNISLQSKNTGLRTMCEFDPGYWPVDAQYYISFNYLYGKYYNFFYK